LPFGYRNQAKLVLRRRRSREGRSEVVLGVYRPGTHSVMPAERCRVHDRRLLPFLVGLRARIEESGLPIFDERSREGALRYALARISTESGAIHLTLVSAVADLPGLDRLVERIRRDEPRLEAAFLCVNSSPGNAILSPDVRRLFGPKALLERFGRLVLESRPDAFVQANPGVATRIYADAERWLEPAAGDAVLDLFGGVGAFGLALAPRVGRVLGIETSGAAVECANGNAKRAHQRHVTYVAAPAEGAGALAREHGLVPVAGGRLLVVANPPRAGLSEAVRRAIVEFGPARLLYLSCNPATLARDLDALVAAGFSVRRMRPFDMLPQTPHVEVLTVLDGPAVGQAVAGDS
jgi:23S rRNA (uracil1939-C5)-methyltransferase